MNTNLFKPVIKARAKHISFFILIGGLVMIALGIYLGFFQSNGFEKTTAVITRVEKVDEETSRATATYTVNGRTYTEVLDSFSPSWKEGKEITVKYDPADPSVVHAYTPGLTVYLIAIGALLVILELLGFLKNRRQKEELAAEETGPLFRAPRRGEEERKLYFLTDLGTAKGTCHIEDAQRKVLYEAVCTKFNLVGDSRYEFVDHVLNRRTPHLIGKTADSESNAIWVLDKHSTFDLDGKDIWKLLHDNGVTIRTGLDGLKWAYTILRNGEEIATAVNTNKLVHEEDAEAKGALAKVPFPGFFRIVTREENLDVIFLTLMAIGRTDMMFYN